MAIHVVVHFGVLNYFLLYTSGMHFFQWLHLFFQQVKETPLLQWIGVGFGVAEVLLARRNKIALYPCGILSILISVYALYQSALYAECLLNAYYFIMSVYGWWYWIKRKNEPPVKISYATAKEWGITIGITAVAFALLCFSLIRYTDSDVPVWDAWVSATAWAGMWLLARRKVENWVLLNISNAFAIPLLIHKGLPLYALLTLFLFVIAILGFFDWKKTVTQNRQMHLPVTASSL